jgi:hypothetical protein
VRAGLAGRRRWLSRAVRNRVCACKRVRVYSCACKTCAYTRPTSTGLAGLGGSEDEYDGADLDEGMLVGHVPRRLRFCRTSVRTFRLAASRAAVFAGCSARLQPCACAACNRRPARDACSRAPLVCVCKRVRVIVFPTQASLLGTARESAADEEARASLHAAWEQQRDGAAVRCAAVCGCVGVHARGPPTRTKR